MKKIVIATGSRADWGLLLPLARELRNRGVEPIIIATYAHLFKEMGNTIQELIDDGFPPSMSIPARMKHSEAIADTTLGFTKAFSFLKPDIVIILGDRFEMLGVATAALLEHVPVAHIAGGTVSEGAIDDTIRNAITKMASLHFPETNQSRERLLAMGEKEENITVCGALGVYNASIVDSMTKDELEDSIGFKLGDSFMLGTFHPATLDELSAIEQMRIWLDGVKLALERNPGLKVLLTYPNTDADPAALLMLMYQLEMENQEKVKVVDSLGRKRYLNAARMASVVAGNSSSGIVEVPSLGTPVVDVGIRQNGRERSEAIIHCDLAPEKIADALDNALSAETLQLAKTAHNPYFMSDTPSIIADTLLK